MRVLTVYGDSIAAGYGAPPGQGFAAKLASRAAAAGPQPVRCLDFGVPGMTSPQLASALRDNDAWCAGLRAASSVCVLIGGDDIVGSIPALLSSRPQSGIERMLAASAAAYAAVLAAIRGAGRVRLAVGTLYNPFPNTALAETAVSAYNEFVIRPAAGRAGAAVAPVHAAFAGRQAALIHGYSDGVAGAPGRGGVRHPVHPNARGHAAIADAFAAGL